MTSRREQILVAVKALVIAALPAADVKRAYDAAKPGRIAAGGEVIIREGDPGEPEVDLSPLSYNYEHRIPLEIATPPGVDPTAALDAMLVAIGGAVAADRTLGGLVDFLDAEAPTIEDLDTLGGAPTQWADTAIIAAYASPNPLT